jgi:parallel beta-helix repeat protein
LSPSSSNTITNNNASNNAYSGICLYMNSDDNTITNNTASNNAYGIALVFSDDNTIANNNASNNNCGIFLDTYSTINTIVNNTASSNYDYGIYLNQSNSNTIANNTVLNNGDGIYLQGSDSNTIANNTASNNNYGIYLKSSSNGNIIFHNNIIGNAIQAFDDTNDDNQWDNGYPGGGNYWSDYGGFDEYGGPNQDILGSDGIGDINYSIDLNSQDNYPLMGFIDEIGPRIYLISPANNSVIQPGVILDLYVYDEDLDVVNYSIDGGMEQSFDPPFNISTAGLDDGLHNVLVNATDLSNHLVSKTFLFTIDSRKPIIQLNSPNNNSIIPDGTFLNFSITDLHLWQVNYAVNGGSYVSLSDPFNISTSDWPGGNYTVQINALDQAGNLNFSWFNFTMNSIRPTIHLNSPLNNSVIPGGIFLNFSVTDLNLGQVNYSINGGSNINLSEPFNISTSGWPSGHYTVQINAVDMAGNSNSSWFFFTIDSIKPLIQLNSPGNNSVISSGIFLNFSITDQHPGQVNYSINGGSNISLPDPFDIPTSGWPDGDYTVQINAVDMAGNSNSSWYLFTIDNTPPTIILSAPGNNSIIPSGILLNFSVLDANLIQVNISINSGADVPLPDPFNISTVDWSDGDYTVQINAVDLLGNINSSWFFFTIDSTQPTIVLNNPWNSSIIPSGTLLDFSVDDSHLDIVNYTINGGTETPILDPFDISTAGWTDGNYTVQINALDLAGNTNSTWYFFTVDSTPPTINLESPTNNSIIPDGTSLYFSIIDSNLIQVDYSINGGDSVPFSDPYNIWTSGWADGDYAVQINALDLAGNSNSSWFFFTIDSTPPTIEIDPALNHTIIPIGRVIQFNISDPDTDSVMYSMDGNEYPITGPAYVIDTSDWSDGSHTITVKANDTTGNEAEIWFKITVDAIPPFVYYTFPSNNSDDVAIDSTIVITFNEPMNTSNMNNYLSFSSSANIIYYWGSNNKDLYISFESSNLDRGTTYTLTIDSQIADINGISMGSDFVFVFTTKPLDTDEDGTPDSEDDDDDDDGYLDEEDAFPLNASEWLDTDSDGIGNNADPDDDDDGTLDENDYDPLDPNIWKKAEKPSDMTWLWFVLLAIIVVSIVVLLLFMRKRGFGSEEIPQSTEEEIDFEVMEEEDQGLQEQQPPPLPPSATTRPTATSTTASTAIAIQSLERENTGSNYWPKAR